MIEIEEGGGREIESEGCCVRGSVCVFVCEREISKERERSNHLLISCNYLFFPQFLNSSITPRYFAKGNSIPCFLNVRRSVVRYFNACNRRTRLDRPVQREVKNMYLRTYRLTYARINFVREKR